MDSLQIEDIISHLKIGSESSHHKSSENSKTLNIPVGRRNTHFTKRAVHLRKIGTSEEKLADILIEENSCNRIPLPQKDINKIIDWASRTIEPEVQEELTSFTIDEVIKHSEEQKLPIIGQGILPTDSILLLTGPAKIGKTILAQNILLSIALEIDFPILPETHPGIVLSIHGEMSKFMMRDRLIKQTLQFDENTNYHYIFSSSIDILDDKIYRRIKKIISEIQPNIIAFDSLASIHSADENSNTAMQSVMNQIRSLLTPDRGIIIVHHTGKSYDNTGLNRSRGASSITAAVDTIIDMVPTSKGIRLDYTLRNGAPLPSQTIRLNPATLWFESIHSKTNERTARILKIVNQAGSKGIHKRDLIKQISSTFDVSYKAAYDWINPLIKSGEIKQGSQKRNPILITQKGNHEGK